MRIKLLKLAILGSAIFSVVNATEFRSPWISERGPIRYKFERGDPDNYTLDVYSTIHRKESHKAFLKHGTDTKPLTALFFNKSDIPLKEIFPNSTMSTDAKYYNPFMDLMTIHPRATYYEWGFNLGCRFEYPVWQDIGRIGFRVNVPFRLIEIERENITDKLDDTVEDYILPRHVTVETGVASAGTANVLAKAYNLGFINKLFAAPDRTLALEMGNDKVKVFGQNIKSINVLADNQKMADHIQTPAGVIYTYQNGRPREPGADQKWAFNFGNNVADDGWGDHAIDLNGNPAVADLNTVEVLKKGIALFNKAIIYTTLGQNQTQLDTMWLVLGYENGILPVGAKCIKDGIENAIKSYDADPYQWLLAYGPYEFETRRLTGVGDIDLDIFYEHTFSDEWISEVMMGVKIPTGNHEDYVGNPYKVHLGNGEHWEFKVGGMLAWQPLKWMNVKFDMYFSWVLEALEKKCAAFKGAKIKNMGPGVNTDVCWEYWVSRLDFNFFHPKTNDISGTVGYEFYYKTKDNIYFRESQKTPFYGSHHTDATNLLKSDLDNTLAEANTEAIGHKIRSEIRCKLDKELEIFAGGSYMFAGQNLPRETDVHGGFNVRF